MNEVKTLLDERRHGQIPSGKKVKDGHWANLTWKREAGEPELLLEDSDPKTSNLICRKFAETMEWFDPNNANDIHAGRNLVISYPLHVRDASELSTRLAIGLDNTWLYLSSKADFRLINLNATFVDALNLHARPLSVTAKVTANRNTVSQPLGQVYYAPQGRERYLFTPPVEEWFDVQTNHWDEVELSLRELDDKLVTFQSDSQCLMRLHFKKE